MKDRTHDEAMAGALRADPAYAVELLNSILADGAGAELVIALRQMGAEPAGATLADVAAALRVLGLRLVIQPAALKLSC